LKIPIGEPSQGIDVTFEIRSNGIRRAFSAGRAQVGSACTVAAAYEAKRESIRQVMFDDPQFESGDTTGTTRL